MLRVRACHLRVLRHLLVCHDSAEHARDPHLERCSVALDVGAAWYPVHPLKIAQLVARLWGSWPGASDQYTIRCLRDGGTFVLWEARLRLNQ